MVFGLPLQMNGQEGEIAAEVRAFADKLQQAVELPLAFGTKDCLRPRLKAF